MMNDTPIHTLIVGYGNELRSDDGVGVQVAQIASEWRVPDVRSLWVHQLMPELAAEIATAQQVIFVDAYPALPHQDIQVFRLSMLPVGSMGSHCSTPWALLALARTVYHCCPLAWWVLVPGTIFALGDRLSPTARRGIAQAIKQIIYLIEDRDQQTQSLSTISSIAGNPCMKSVSWKAL